MSSVSLLLDQQSLGREGKKLLKEGKILEGVHVEDQHH